MRKALAPFMIWIRLMLLAGNQILDDQAVVSLGILCATFTRSLLYSCFAPVRLQENECDKRCCAF